ncbi:hypothetical protein TNCV_4422541 [Trichonephila clavipes]|nr:hypothetical protein TNCV_4422541 [Trichonephila clavipes]
MPQPLCHEIRPNGPRWLLQGVFALQSLSTPSITAGDNLEALHFKYDQARRRFVEWSQNEIAVVPDFHKRILFSDEAHFWLNG